MATAIDEVLHDLAAEYTRLDGILSSLSEAQWQSPSGAPGWTIRDVVVHLASSETGVATTLERASDAWTTRDRPLDAAVDDAVRADHHAPSIVFAAWRAATRDSIGALRSADPDRSYQWAAAPLRPRTLATTRLAEHWAHGLDITDPLGMAFEDTDRLRHVAWLGHATIPYGLRLQGKDSVAVRCALTAPDGGIWTLGPDDAAAMITGPASAFCRVGAQRLTPAASGLVATGPGAHDALAALRNYAA